MQKLFSVVSEEEKNKINTGEDILYLLLLEYSSKDDNKENIRDWKFIYGRQNAYDYIKDILMNEEEAEYILSVDESLIYADNPNVPDEKNKLRISNGVNIYRFMRDCFVLQKVVDEGGFDINDFHVEDKQEDDE